MGPEAGLNLFPVNADARLVSSCEVAGACKTGLNGKPVVVVIFQRDKDTNHFHYGTMNHALGALQLCELAALRSGLSMNDIECYPVATHSIIGRSNRVEAQRSLEWEQLRSFQRRVFGRDFLESCTELAGARVLAVTFGESPHPLLNFPHVSSRNVMRWDNVPSETDRTILQACAQLTPDTVNDFFGAPCQKFKDWRISHGQSTDLPRINVLHRAIKELQSRVIGPKSAGTILERRVALFQRSNCPFPPRFHRNDIEWEKLYDMKVTHNHRCLLNIVEIEDGLTTAGYNVDVLDFGDVTMFSDYDAVVKALQSVSIFIGVEGSGSLHALFLPKGRSGFLQLHPHRDYDDKSRLHGGSDNSSDNIDLFTDAWMHYAGVCVHNLR